MILGVWYGMIGFGTCYGLCFVRIGIGEDRNWDINNAVFVYLGMYIYIGFFFVFKVLPLGFVIN